MYVGFFFEVLHKKEINHIIIFYSQTTKYTDLVVSKLYILHLITVLVLGLV